MKCVTFTACLAVLGCGSETKPQPPPPAPVAVDGIALVAPGAEPRRSLRYALRAGTETPLELGLDLDLETADGAAAMPTLAMSLDVAVTGVDPTGIANLKLSVAAAGARPRKDEQKDAPAVAVMDRQAMLIGGLVMTYTLSPAGKVTDSKIEAVGRDLSGPMQQQVTTLIQVGEQLAMSLPEPPVGVGARWTHRRTMQQNQLTLTTLTDVEVTAIDGDRVTFKSTTTLSGPDQTITQGTATAQVTAIRGSGSQTGTFDLAKAVVLGESRAELGFEMVVEGQRRPTKMIVVTRIHPRTNDSPTPPEGSASGSAGSEPAAKPSHEHQH